ncbi:MAG: phenylacetate--CoA ligase family protein, partial [Calditrichaeota bacterium]
TERGRLTFKYIPKDTLNDAVLKQIERRLLEKLGDDVVLRSEAVSFIPLTRRGKHRFLIQQLPLEFGDA